MEPIVPQKAPYGMEIEAGIYFWCACGRSAKQPFCDGSHKGSGISPLKLVVEEKRKVWLCGCKHTRKPPFCDGTHKVL